MIRPILASHGRPVRSAGGPARVSYELLKRFVEEGPDGGASYLDLRTGTLYHLRSLGELEGIAREEYLSPSGLQKAVQTALGLLGSSAEGVARKWFYRYLVYRIARQMAQGHGNLLHIHGVSPTLANLSPFRFPVVWSEHSKGSVLREHHMLHGEPPRGELLRSLQRTYEKLLQESHRITFPSWAAVHLFEEYTRWEVPRERLRIVYNGLSDPLAQYADIPREEPSHGLVVTVAQHVPEKGLDLALKALVHSERPWRWLVLGQETPWTERLKEEVQRHSGKVQVRLMGSLPHREAMGWLYRAGVVLATQRVAIFDLAILEAMALGKPIVATRVGGNVEALGEDYPLLAQEVEELASALQRVYDDPTMAQELGERNRRRFLEGFTLEAMERAYRKVYHEAAQSR